MSLRVEIKPSKRRNKWKAQKQQKRNERSSSSRRKKMVGEEERNEASEQSEQYICVYKQQEDGVVYIRCAYILRPHVSFVLRTLCSSCVSCAVLCCVCGGVKNRSSSVRSIALRSVVHSRCTTWSHCGSTDITPCINCLLIAMKLLAVIRFVCKCLHRSPSTVRYALYTHHTYVFHKLFSKCWPCRLQCVCAVQCCSLLLCIPPCLSLAS